VGVHEGGASLKRGHRFGDDTTQPKSREWGDGMKRFKGALIGFIVLALAAVACGNEEPTVSGSPTASPSTEIPTISIGACQTKQGAQPLASPKRADFKTQLKEPGVLNVGSDNDYPPFEEIKPGQKKPVGFDVDLYTEVARRLGLQAKSTTTNFDALFTQSLPSGKFDLGVSAITIKEERKQRVDFTVPYFVSDLSLAINVERTPEIRTIDDLSGKTIGAQKGTTGETCAQYLIDQGKAKALKTFADTGPAFQDLVVGRLAAVVNDRPASEGFIEKNSDLRVVQVIRTKEQYGMAISKEKPDLREAINQKLLEIMRDGTFARIYKKWLGTEPPFEVPLAIS
jgi:ABC-type amino acid transport substrate-binding protein